MALARVLEQGSAADYIPVSDPHDKNQVCLEVMSADVNPDPCTEIVAILNPKPYTLIPKYQALCADCRDPQPQPQNLNPKP